MFNPKGLHAQQHLQMVYLSKKPTGQRVDGDVEVHSVSQSALSVTFGLGNVNMPLASTNKCLMVFQAQIINDDDVRKSKSHSLSDINFLVFCILNDSPDVKSQHHMSSGDNVKTFNDCLEDKTKAFKTWPFINYNLQYSFAKQSILKT